MKNPIFFLANCRAAAILACASLLSTVGSAQTAQPAQTPQTQQPGSTQPAQKPATPPANNRQIPSLVGGPTPQTQAPPAGPPHKTPPAAKTNEEFAAYNAAVANPDTAAAEKSADDFATKFTQSDLRGLLYSAIMRRYQQANDPEKTLEMARKVLTYEPTDPVALVMAATVLAERTREGDLDREERYDEATKYAQRSLETVNSDLMVPSNATAEQIESAKKVLQSMAHSAIGMVQLDRKNDAVAVQEFQQSIALSTQGQIEPLTYLRLALAQDHLKQYPAALVSANKAVEISPANSPVAMLAKQEVDRLTELSKAGAPPASNPAPAPPTTNVPPK